MRWRRVVLTGGLIGSAVVGACVGWLIDEATRPIQLAGRWTERWSDDRS